MDLLQILRCPACASQLRWERRISEAVGDEYGILSCAHHTYPVVAGIPMMLRGETQEILGALRSGRSSDALIFALNTTRKACLQTAAERSRLLKRIPGAASRIHHHCENTRLARARSIQATAGQGGSFRDLLQATFGYAGKSDTVDYFFYKFGQPRYLAALAWVPALVSVRGWVLDFGCGPGHLVWSLAQNGARERVVGADLYFKSLYLARRLAGSSARFVCCNADYGLPFRDGAFGAIVSADAWHFLAYPVPCLRELQRMLQDGGLLTLVSVPNPEAKSPELRTGWPPALRRWPELMGEMPFRLLSNHDLITRYRVRRGPDARHSVPESRWPEVPVVTLAASHDERRWLCEHEPFAQWPHAAGKLAINPLYRLNGKRDGRDVYRLHFPSEFYASENDYARTYMPDEVVVPPAGAGPVETGTLIAEWFLVAAPPHYGASPWVHSSIKSGVGSGAFVREPARL